MRRLKIVKDDKTFDERTNRLLKDVRRQMDNDLMNFGFDRRTNQQLLSSIGAGHDSDEDDDGGDLMGKLLGSKGAKGTRSLLGARKMADEDSSFFPSRSTTTTTKFGFSGNNGKGDAFPGATTAATTTTTSTSVLSSDDNSDFSGPSDQGGKPFSVSFNLAGFDAEDISVTCEDGILTVGARHETNNNGAISVKEFNRKVQVPNNVKPEQLESSFTTDGILTVEAPPDPSLFQQQQQQQLQDSSKAAGSSCGSSDPASIPLDTPIVTTEATGRKKLDLVIEMGPPYEPDDVVIRLDGRNLKIEATHEVKTSGRSSKTSMNRDFDLEEDFDPASLDATLTNGKLFVTGLTFRQGKCKVVTS